LPKASLERYKNVEIYMKNKDKSIDEFVMSRTSQIAHGDLRNMLTSVKNGGPVAKDSIIIGFLSAKVISFLTKKSMPVHTKAIYINAKGLSHLQRDTKKKRDAALSDSDILEMPKVLDEPDYLLFDNKKNKLNLLYCLEKECGKLIKIVVDTKYIHKKLGKITLIKTAGIIKLYNLNVKEYEVIEKAEGR